MCRPETFSSTAVHQHTQCNQWNGSQQKAISRTACPPVHVHVTCHKKDMHSLMRPSTFLVKELLATTMHAPLPLLCFHTGECVKMLAHTAVHACISCYAQTCMSLHVQRRACLSQSQVYTHLQSYRTCTFPSLKTRKVKLRPCMPLPCFQLAS